MKGCKRWSRYYPIFKSITRIHEGDENRDEQINQDETPSLPNLNEHAAEIVLYEISPG